MSVGLSKIAYSGQETSGVWWHLGGYGRRASLETLQNLVIRILFMALLSTSADD